jgi:protein involved in polysaccharide export with SLBB domain
MKTRRVSFLFGLTILGCVWPGASFAADASAKSTDSKAAATAIPGPLHPEFTYQTTNYILHPTDVISIKVVDDDSASGSFTVSATGTLQLTYLDPRTPLKVAGLTPAEAVQLISQAYVDAKIFIKPTITLTVTNYAERRINVVGQVGSLGTVDIPPEQSFSLASAIAKAHADAQRNGSSQF